MSEDFSELDLHAYVDGELDAERRFAVESYLSDHPPLAAKVMDELRRRTALRLLAYDRSSPSASAVRQAADLPTRSGRLFKRGGALFAGLAIASACAFLLIPRKPPSYVDMAVASHRVAMIRAKMPSQIEAPRLDAREILSNTQIKLPALPRAWHVTDVQVFPTKGGPALLVAVRTMEGQNLSIFALHQRSSAPEIPDAVRAGRQSVAYWRQGDMSYALTGDDEPWALDRAAEGLDRS